jgi:hypothetical protein
VINGVKYARIIAQHVLHIVRFSDDSAMVGGTFGVRKYAVWDAVPQAAHDRVTNRHKEQLKTSYDSVLRGREVVETMLDVLRFFQAVNPEMVHRDDQGEWVGFPLMSQPGVSAPLHPEEPLEVEAAWQWLNDRTPNGDARVVCGQVTLNSTRYLCGSPSAAVTHSHHSPKQSSRLSATSRREPPTSKETYGRTSSTPPRTFRRRRALSSSAPKTSIRGPRQSTKSSARLIGACAAIRRLGFASRA